MAEDTTVTATPAPATPVTEPAVVEDNYYVVYNQKGEVLSSERIHRADNNYYVCFTTKDVYRRDSKGNFLSKYGYVNEDGSITRFDKELPVEQLTPGDPLLVIDENGDIRKKNAETGAVCGTVIGKELTDGTLIRIPVGAVSDREGNISFPEPVSYPPYDPAHPYDPTRPYDPRYPQAYREGPPPAAPTPPPTPIEEVGMTAVADQPEQVIDLGFSKEEIDTLPWKDNGELITYRSGPEYHKFDLGKYVVTPWNKIYKIKERTNFNEGNEKGKFFEKIDNPEYVALPEDENGNKIFPEIDVEFDVTNEETGEVTKGTRKEAKAIPEKILSSKVILDYGPYLSKLDEPSKKEYENSKHVCKLVLEYVREREVDLSHLAAREIELPAVDNIEMDMVAGIKFPAIEAYDLDEFEMDIPAATSATISIWSVPKCAEYPEGYYIVRSALWAKRSDIQEPGCADWEKRLLLRVRFESDLNLRSSLRYQVCEKDSQVKLDMEALAGKGYVDVLPDKPYQS